MLRRGGSLLQSTVLTVRQSNVPTGVRVSARPVSSSAAAKASQPTTIFSGIQPTGVPHLGNYLGALRQWVKLQDNAVHDTTLIYALVDLHAITIRQEPKQLRQWKKESLAMLLAIGLNPRRSIIFHQSDVPAHSELMWILSCQASTGQLGRMTQWKDKTANEREGSERLKLGLFSYPVLQAADILVHGATHVPVGHDQAQHLEFSRQIANGFNEMYGRHILVPPETIISPAKRIMSLAEPTKKMSKSHANQKSRVLLTDPDDIVRSKINSAITDSITRITYDPQHRPGVSNLVEILFHSAEGANAVNPDELAKELDGLSMRALKERVADAVCHVINPIRVKYEQIMGDPKILRDVAEGGAERAAKNTATMLANVKEAVGLS